MYMRRSKGVKIITVNDRMLCVTNYGVIMIWRNNKWNFCSIYTDKRGYQRVLINHKYYRVHRLVAYAFGISPTIEKVEGLDVDHIDNDVSNNAASNLQLISSKANRKKEHDHVLSQMNYCYGVYEVKEELEIKCVCKSLSEVAEMIGCDSSFVSQVVNGKRKQCKGFVIKRISKEV